MELINPVVNRWIQDGLADPDGLWEDAWDLAKAMQFDPAWPPPADFQI